MAWKGSLVMPKRGIGAQQIVTRLRQIGMLMAQYKSASVRADVAYFALWIAVLAMTFIPHALKAEECANAGEVHRYISLSNGNMINAEAVIHVYQCDYVILKWGSNRPETVKLQEYGIELPVVPDMPSEMAFKATMVGRFRFALKNADGSFKPMRLSIEVRPGH
jgi:hypothetical protein